MLHCCLLLRPGVTSSARRIQKAPAGVPCLWIFSEMLCFPLPFLQPQVCSDGPGGPGTVSASPGGPCSPSLLGTTRALGCGAATHLGHIVSPSQLLALRIHH